MEKNIKIIIDDTPIDMHPEKLSLAVNYILEDADNFQNKPSTSAFDVSIPATSRNDKVANSFHSPSIEDMTEGEAFRKPLKAVIDVNGEEILNGRALLKSATHTDRPIAYTFDFYGNNFDWFIELKETTLFDLVKHIQFNFAKSHMMTSWLFDGRDEQIPYVFVPVRYKERFDRYLDVIGGATMTEDYSVNPLQMRPSLSVYWVLFWMFKRVGYRIDSKFFDTDMFRRLVMPWTWGNFLYSDQSTMNQLDFLAKSTSGVYYDNEGSGSHSETEFWDLDISNDSINGAFDNNGVYEYDAVNREAKWRYLPQFNFGKIRATFYLQIFVDATVSANSDIELRAQIFKNGVKQITPNDNGNGTEIVSLSAPSLIGRRDKVGTFDYWFTVDVMPLDIISLKLYKHSFKSFSGRSNIRAEVLSWELDYISIPLDGNINFNNYTFFQKHKALDFFRGIVDTFNLSISTDSKNKTVYIEPTHGDKPNSTEGFFNGNILDYSDKQDLSKESTIELYSDHDRELILKFKEDTNDGLLKTINERYKAEAGSCKYLFPERMNAGKKEYVNRFFSPVIHIERKQWRGYGSDPAASPQIVSILPENVSNTSRDESANSFAPKLCYYKGLIDNVGWVFDGIKTTTYPYMFAVNYQVGGEEDPVLSYTNERIGDEGNYKLGIGLLQKYFLQRFAIMSNGQYYTTNFLLTQKDINKQHREYLFCQNQKWELIQIDGYKPSVNESTTCRLRKCVPISEKDFESIFPSKAIVTQSNLIAGEHEIPYTQLLALASDVK